MEKSQTQALVLDPQKDGRLEPRGSVEEQTLRSIRLLINQELTGSEQFVGGLATFEPGTKVSLHEHPDAEEVNVVVAGSGLFVTAAGKRPLKLGDWQFIPKGVAHAHENDGTEPFTILWLYSPPTLSVPK
jgi:quercetin dioxygenase-like cupin family protein